MRLTPNWIEALDNARRLGKEVEADELTARRHRLKSRAYHGRHRVKADPAPAEGKMRERRESYPKRRRAAIERAIACLFAERPEYQGRRTGQITCRVVHYLEPDFPRGPDGVPKDAEIEAILNGVARRSPEQGQVA